LGIARSVLLWSSQNRWIENQFRRRRFAQKAVSRFMPGEEVDSALVEAKKLGERNISAVVTQLGENLASIGEAEQVAAHYVSVLDKVNGLGLNCHVSVKLTQLGLDIDPKQTAAHLEALVLHASRGNNVIWVDMEASNYVDATLDLYSQLRERHENIGVCLQAYLHRTPQDVEKLLAMGSAIRLVKGAYQEPPDVAMPRKRDVDDAFLRLSTTLAEHAAQGAAIRPGIATHDLAIIAELRRIAAERQWDNAFEIQMLYGIRRAEQLRLAEAGVPTRVLISYGASWFAWYMRRLAERPANIGFVLRTMFSR
jgi:proline dehydrogenase